MTSDEGPRRGLDPTRAAVLAAVRRAPGPVSVADLKDRVPVRGSALRAHLAALVTDGVLAETIERGTGPGRPRRRYAPLPGAVEALDGSTPREELSVMLVDVATSGRPPAEVGRVHGARLADEVRAADATGAVEAVARRLGFDPQRVGSEILLRTCPFARAAEHAPGVVCVLHRGVAEGAASRAGDPGLVRGLHVEDPRRGACRFVLRAGAA